MQSAKDTVYLSRGDLEILRRMGGDVYLDYMPPELLQAGMVAPYALGDGYVITPRGVAYLDYMDVLAHDLRWTRVHAWINTGISIAAVLVSIIAIVCR